MAEQLSDDWPAGRIVHLIGGCRAINNPGPTVDLDPLTINAQLARITLRSYGTIYSDLDALGLSVIGVNFYSHILEVEGRTPPNWRVFHRETPTGWPCEDTATKWSHIGHSAHKRKNGRLWDLASRLAHQTRVCSWRLRQISEAYHDQLAARIRNKDFKDGQRFEDGFAWLAYLSIQAFLIDACVLRDYLAEFVAFYMYEPRHGVKKPQVTSMGALRKRFLDKVSDVDSISSYLRIATGEGGWLKELGDYRDLVVHSAPLAQAQQKLWAIAELLKIRESEALPAIRCPLPEDPHGIASARSRGDHFDDFTIQLKKFVKASTGENPNKDGLIYAHQVLGKLCELSAMVSDQSPVPPETMVFDRSNIIGPIRVLNE